MAAIRRHWLLVLTGGTVALLGLMGAVVLTGQRPAAAEPAAPGAGAWSPADASAVEGVRAAVQLPAQTLAAMGCDAEAARRSLLALRSWYLARKAALAEADAAVFGADSALRAAMERVNVGPRDAALLGSLPALREAVTTAMRGRQELLQTVVPAVEATLTQEQRAVWKAARDHAGLPAPYGYLPDLTAQQEAELAAAFRRRAGALASAPDAAAARAAQDAFQTSLGQVLSSGQRTAAEEVGRRINQSMSAVSAVEAELTPTVE